jgi:hypothetical protein
MGKIPAQMQMKCIIGLHSNILNNCMLKFHEIDIVLTKYLESSIPLKLV